MKRKREDSEKNSPKKRKIAFDVQDEVLNCPNSLAFFPGCTAPDSQTEFRFFNSKNEKDGNISLLGEFDGLEFRGKELQGDLAKITNKYAIGVLDEKEGNMDVYRVDKFFVVERSTTKEVLKFEEQKKAIDRLQKNELSQFANRFYTNKHKKIQNLLNIKKEKDEENKRNKVAVNAEHKRKARDSFVKISDNKKTGIKDRSRKKKKIISTGKREEEEIKPNKIEEAKKEQEEENSENEEEKNTFSKKIIDFSEENEDVKEEEGVSKGEDNNKETEI